MNTLLDMITGTSCKILYKLTTKKYLQFPVSLLRGVEKMFIDSPGDAQQALLEATATLTRHAAHIQFTDEVTLHAASFLLSKLKFPTILLCP